MVIIKPSMLQKQTVDIGVGIFLTLLLLMISSAIIDDPNTIDWKTEVNETSYSHLNKLYWMLIVATAIAITFIFITVTNSLEHYIMVFLVGLFLYLYAFMIYKSRPLLSYFLIMCGLTIYGIALWNGYVIYDNIMVLIAAVFVYLGLVGCLIAIYKLKDSPNKSVDLFTTSLNYKSSINKSPKLNL